MVDEAANPSVPPAAAGAGGPPDAPGPGAAGGGWWRGPAIAALIAIPLLAAGVGARLGCEAGALDLPVCGDQNAAVSDRRRRRRDRRRHDDRRRHRRRPARRSPTIQEPAATFPGQFLKFVVAAPDNSRVLYVTAADLGMADATLWVVPRGGTKALLKPLGDDFWVARPVWCQARPGDPGRIAYVMRGPVAGNLTGLELWVDQRRRRRRPARAGRHAAERPRPRPLLRRPPDAAALHGRLRAPALRRGDGADQHVVDLDSGGVRRADRPARRTGRRRRPPRPPAPAAPTPAAGRPATSSRSPRPTRAGAAT